MIQDCFFFAKKGVSSSVASWQAVVRDAWKVEWLQREKEETISFLGVCWLFLLLLFLACYWHVLQNPSRVDSTVISADSAQFWIDRFVLVSLRPGSKPKATIEDIFPQQRKLMGSSAQISSGVCRCGLQEQVPEEGSGRFRKVPESSGVCWCSGKVPESSGVKW